MIGAKKKMETAKMNGKKKMSKQNENKCTCQCEQDTALEKII